MGVFLFSARGLCFWWFSVQEQSPSLPRRYKRVTQSPLLVAPLLEAKKKKKWDIYCLSLYLTDVCTF
jgi:hypothetical protein